MRVVELASRIAVQALGELVEEGTAEERLASTVRLANRRVAERATSDPRASGMGSTVTAALVGPASVAFAHVGDSRAYLWRGGVLTRLSDDHSLVAEWVKAGALAPEEAALHPQRSVITRALGADWQVDVDPGTTPARAGDGIQLCTDGLTGFVDEAAIAQALEQHDDLDVAVHALVDAANAAGGEDNITAVAARLEAEEAAIGAAVVADERETGEIDVPAELASAEQAGESTAVAVAVPPPVDDAVAPLSSRPVPVPLPRSGETLISVPAVVTGFGSGAPVRRRGRARRLGVFASVAALMLCVAAGAAYALASDEDFRTEWYSLDLSVRTVPDLDAALDHIRTFGTQHTEAIVTEDRAAARRFTSEVDAAVVMVNASSRFTDGAEFGFGAEIGISTQKLHARGPMALPELTTTKWVVEGDGQVRV